MPFFLQKRVNNIQQNYMQKNRGCERVLKNLKVALEQKGIAVRALAGIMGVSERTAWNKINEDTDITYREAKKNF